MNNQQSADRRPGDARMQPPGKQGLYDPAFEHDACGVGFLANIKGRRSHDIVRSGLEILLNLDHRGACGAEPNTGDGAGILIQVPDEFLREVTQGLGFQLPEPGQYGVGMFYLPRDPAERRACEDIVARLVAEEGQTLLGWRDLPTDNASLGKTALASEPFMRQLFVARDPALADELAFERKLYVIRKRAENEIRYSGRFAESRLFYVSSLSCRTCIYKGMLMPEQVGKYYLDLGDPRMTSALAVVHSRFSTNTFPSWDRSHPYRYLAHNGEINTLRGNVNWMRAR